MRAGVGHLSPEKEASSFTTNSSVPGKPQLHERAELNLMEVFEMLNMVNKPRGLQADWRI